jgi:serine protease AprX
MRTTRGTGEGLRARTTGVRTFVALATAGLSLAVGVGASAAGGGNQGQQQQGQQGGTTYVAGSLLARAAANPAKQFQVIVQTRSESSEAAVAGWAARNNGRLKSRFRLITGIGVKLPGAAIVYLVQHDGEFGQISITEDTPVSLLGQTGPTNWQATVGADRLWSHPEATCALDPLTALPVDPLCSPIAAYTAPQAPAIAVVDSGIDPAKAADFGARVVARANFADAVAGDPEGHGTMVAGVAAGAANPASGGGVAQNAALVDVRVANGLGEARTSDVIAGLDWILANKAAYGIRVVNLSLAGNVEASIRFDPLDQAVEKLWLNGLVVVAAAGNNGLSTGPAPLGAPGNDPFVITVGALDTEGTVTPADDTRAPWSAYGYTADGFLKPELTAPGRYIVAPVPDGSYLPAAKPERVVAPGYMWMSGTSFSAPAVAGAAAQLLALHPEWTADQVKGALMASAARLPAQDGGGIGELDAPAAAAVPAPPNPNENLYAFVASDPASGLLVFSAANWTSAVATSANWTSANWTSANWTSANWTSANWTSANWTSANWTSANWTSAAWVK